MRETISQLEKAPDLANMPLSYINDLIALSRFVGRVERMDRRSVGTGFLIRGRDLFQGWGEELLFVTAEIVLSESKSKAGISYHEAEIVFAQVDEKVRHSVDEVLWFSDARGGHNCCVCRLASTPDIDATPFQLAQSLPVLDEKQNSESNRLTGKAASKIMVIGHPHGGELVLSIENSFLIDHEDVQAPEVQPVRIHYSAETAPGSSGSPVLDQRSLEVIGIHSSAGKMVPLSSGKLGAKEKYQSGEGFWIQAIRNQIAADLEERIEPQKAARETNKPAPTDNGSEVREPVHATAIPEEHLPPSHTFFQRIRTWVKSLPLATMGAAALAMLLANLGFGITGRWIDGWAGLLFSPAAGALPAWLSADHVGPALIIGLPLLAAILCLRFASKGWRAGSFSGLSVLGIFAFFETYGINEHLRLPWWGPPAVALVFLGVYAFKLTGDAHRLGAAISTLWARSKIGWTAVALGIPTALVAATSTEVERVSPVIMRMDGAVSALASGLDAKGQHMVAVADFQGNLKMFDANERYPRPAEVNFSDGKPVIKLIWLPNALVPRAPGEAEPVGQELEGVALARVVQHIQARIAFAQDTQDGVPAHLMRASMQALSLNTRLAPCYGDPSRQACQEANERIGGSVASNIVPIIYGDNDGGQSVTWEEWFREAPLMSLPLDSEDPFATNEARASLNRVVQPGIIAVRDGEVLWWNGDTELGPVTIWQGNGVPVTSVALDGTVLIAPIGNRTDRETGEPEEQSSIAPALGDLLYGGRSGGVYMFDPSNPTGSEVLDASLSIALELALGNATAVAAPTDSESERSYGPIITGSSDGSLNNGVQPGPASQGSAVTKLEFIDENELRSYHRNGSISHWTYILEMDGELLPEVTHLESWPKQEAHLAFVPGDRRFLARNDQGRVTISQVFEDGGGLQEIVELSGFDDTLSAQVNLPNGNMLIGDWSGRVSVIDVGYAEHMASMDPAGRIDLASNVIAKLFKRPEELDPTKSYALLEALQLQERAVQAILAAPSIERSNARSRFAIGSIVVKPKEALEVPLAMVISPEPPSPEPETEPTARGPIEQERSRADAEVFAELADSGLSGRVEETPDGGLRIQTFTDTNTLPVLAISGEVSCSNSDEIDPEFLKSNPVLATECLILELRASGEFEYVEKDWIFTVAQETASPLDEEFSSPDSSVTGIQERIRKGRARASAEPMLPLQWSIAGDHAGTARFDTVWEDETGSDEVVIALIDTGILKEHPDMQSDLILGGWDFVSDPRIGNDGDGRDSDASDPGDICNTDQPGAQNSYHGTQMASIIGGGLNGKGTMPAAPNVRILPVRAIGKCGGRMSDITDAIRWSAGLIPALGQNDDETWNQDPADIINLSIGLFEYCPAALQDAIDAVTERGVVVVAAAGNARVDTQFYAPAGCENVVTVAANDARGYITPYSNYGEDVDLMAPGGDMTRDDTNDGLPDGILAAANSTGCYDLITGQSVASCLYRYGQGTSQAAAHVSAALGLVLSSELPTTPTISLDRLVMGASVAVESQEIAARCEVYPGARPNPENGEECLRPAGRRLDLGSLSSFLASLSVENDSETNQIDWQSAREDFVLAQREGRGDGVFESLNLAAPPPVPIQLPTEFAGGEASSGSPAFQANENGYTATYPGQSYNMVITGRSLENGALAPEGIELKPDGLVLGVKKYGAAYTLEFTCNDGRSNCVSEEEARDVFNSLIPSGSR